MEFVLCENCDQNRVGRLGMSEQFIWPTEMLPLEQELLELFHAIEQDNFRTLDLSATGYSDPRITGSFIRWLLLEVVVASPFAISALRLHNAVIAGVLDFSGKALPIAISFDNCVFNDDIDFTDAAVRMIEVSSCTLGRILADRVTTQGTFRIRRSRTTNSSLSSIKHLRRCGATIGGNLDLRGSLFGSLQADPAFPCIWADGAKVAGNTLLTDGFTSRGEIRLNGACLNRNLDCSSAKMLNRRGFSISAAGAIISGSAYFCAPKIWSDSTVRSPFRSEGAIRLSGAKISGHLTLDEGHFIATSFAERTEVTAPRTTEAHQLRAVVGNGIEVGADLNLRASFVQGAAIFISGKINGDINSSDTNLDFPGQESLTWDSATIGGEAFFEGIRTTGIIRLAQASFAQGLRIHGISFERNHAPQFLDDEYAAGDDLGGVACGVYAPNMLVGGTFYWKNVTASEVNPSRIPCWLFLFGAKCTSIEDDIASWKTLDRFDINGFVYNLPSPPTDIDVRLIEIDRQYDTERFRPQPYMQLARAARDAGYETAANDAIVQMERVRTRRSDFALPKVFWRLFLDIALRYGFAPYRPIIILTMWAVISSFVFSHAYKNKEIVRAESAATASATTRSTVPFNSLLFAIDTLVPIVDFNQKKQWVVTPASRTELPHLSQQVDHSWTSSLSALTEEFPNTSARLFLVFNTFFGWTMTTLFAASVAGLLRRAKDY